MHAVEFESQVEGGMIRIPERYRNTVGSRVKVIVLMDEYSAGKRGCFGPEDFTELKLSTRGWKFDREEANERR